MAGDTSLTIHELTLNEASSAAPAVQAVSTSTGDYTIDVDGVDASKLILHVNYSGADTGAIITVLAGDDYSAVGQGSLTISDAGADTFYVGPLETARFKQDDGKIHIEGYVDSSTSAMSVRAILLP
jgi:predicted dinucleotide-binding enzyme